MKKTPKEVRDEAYRLVREAMSERRETGDEEGTLVIRDLAEQVKRIRLTK